jgi:hypothetical protein
MPAVEPNLWVTLGDLFRNLGQLLALLFAFAAHWMLLIVWIAWWLWAVNWKKCWLALGQGAWAPVVLLLLLTALVWSRLQPAPLALGESMSLPNFWWQLGAMALLTALALFCGWLQGVMHWTPAELDLEPPVHGFEHVHDHSLHVPPDKMAPEPHH